MADSTWSGFDPKGNRVLSCLPTGLGARPSKRLSISKRFESEREKAYRIYKDIFLENEDSNWMY